MARLFDVGPNAVGVFAVGQFAVGVIAFGQFAVGFVAIGQFAAGGLTLGMFSGGLASIGMFAAGIVHATGAGIGGTGRLAVLPLVPRLAPRAVLPPVTTFEAIDVNGWIDASVELRGGDAIVASGERALPVRVVCDLIHPLATMPPLRADRLLAFIERRDDGYVCTRLMRVAAPAPLAPIFWLKTSARIFALAVLSAVWMKLFFLPMYSSLSDGGAATVAPPSAPPSKSRR